MSRRRGGDPQPTAKVTVSVRDSATLVVVRTPPSGGALEVLLLERSAKSAFMGGAFVFPGGKLDAEDEGIEMQSLVTRQTLRWCRQQLGESPGRPLSVERAFGLFIAACRETFEEAGVLFAGGADGRRPGATDLSRWRRRLHDGRATFADMLRALNLRIHLDRLHSWAHWITPSIETRRYDTRFFVAHLPGDQVPVLDKKEAVSQRWMTPDDALQAHRRGEILLPPPTERTIQELTPYGAWTELEAVARDRTPIPILPKVHQVSGVWTIVLPWDAEYAALEGEGCLPGVNPRPDLPTRLRISGIRR